MIHYYTLFRRRLLKNKASFLLNLAGLTLGIACFLFCLLFVFFERSYDDYHLKKDRICRLMMTAHSGGVESREAVTFGFMTEFMLPAFPEIERMVRFDPYDGRTGLRWKPADALVPVEKLYYADSDAFAVFSYRLLAGDTATCLKGSGHIVLTEKLSRRVFGEYPPLGQTVTLNGKPFSVTGVMKDPPGNTDLHFDGLISGAAARDREDFCYTYILFRSAAAMTAFQPKLDTFMKNTLNVQIGTTNNVFLTAALQPLSNLHFSPYLERDTPKGNPVYVEIFLVTGVLVLVIAVTNSINLTVVESFSRVMDVTIRKIYGAKKAALILQHASESLAIGVLATIAAVFLVTLLLPAFAALVNRSMALTDLITWRVLSAAFGGLVLLGAGGAGYASVYLNKVQLSDSLRSQNARIHGLRVVPKMMLGFQCFISIGMLIATIPVYRQVSFFRSTPLGFNPTNVLILELPREAVDSLEGVRQYEKARYLRQTVDRDPDVVVTSLCETSALPGSDADLDVMDYTERHQKVEKVVYHIDVDAHYFALLQIPLLRGEPFREQDDSLAPRQALATASFIKKAGWGQPIGQSFQCNGVHSRVVGVLPDFHFASLHHAFQPLMVFRETRNADDLLVRVNTMKTSAVLRRLQAIWKEIYPQSPFYYSFLDEHLLQQYHDEYNLLSLLLTLTALIIAISCVGLIAYVSFLLRMARAEIAIRRVIGASFQDIYGLFARKFAYLLLVAFMVAGPSAWWFSNKWLNQWAYHVEPRLFDLIIALIAMAMLVGIIVLRWSWVTVQVNPARVLREN